MDSKSPLEEGDWAERKELEKNPRYGLHLYFIHHLSALQGNTWKCSHINFTVGARGSLKKEQFQDRLQSLGVTNAKAKETTRALTVSKALVLSDIILKLFQVSILRSLEWALSSLPTDLSNAQTSSFQLYKNSPAHSAGWLFKKSTPDMYICMHIQMYACICVYVWKYVYVHMYRHAI